MPRTTVNVDEELLTAAREALDTRGVSDTVNAALAAVVRHAALAGFDIRRFSVTDEDIAESRRDRAAG